MEHIMVAWDERDDSTALFIEAPPHHTGIVIEDGNQMAPRDCSVRRHFYLHTDTLSWRQCDAHAYDASVILTRHSATYVTGRRRECEFPMIPMHFPMGILTGIDVVRELEYEWKLLHENIMEPTAGT